jgi:hypothetical protein
LLLKKRDEIFIAPSGIQKERVTVSISLSGFNNHPLKKQLFIL